MRRSFSAVALASFLLVTVCCSGCDTSSAPDTKQPSETVTGKTSDSALKQNQQVATPGAGKVDAGNLKPGDIPPKPTMAILGDTPVRPIDVQRLVTSNSLGSIPACIPEEAIRNQSQVSICKGTKILDHLRCYSTFPTDGEGRHAVELWFAEGLLQYGVIHEQSFRTPQDIGVDEPLARAMSSYADLTYLREPDGHWMAFSPANRLAIHLAEKDAAKLDKIDPFTKITRMDIRFTCKSSLALPASLNGPLAAVSKPVEPDLAIRPSAVGKWMACMMKFDMEQTSDQIKECKGKADCLLVSDAMAGDGPPLTMMLDKARLIGIEIENPAYTTPHGIGVDSTYEHFSMTYNLPKAVKRPDGRWQVVLNDLGATFIISKSSGDAPSPAGRIESISIQYSCR